jgi:large subunit ribosomal protein L4
LDSLTLPETKTKQIIGIFQNFKIDGSVLFLTVTSDEKLEKSIRNVEKVKLITTNNMNVIDLLRFDKLIITKAAIDDIQQKLGQPA